MQELGRRPTSQRIVPPPHTARPCAARPDARPAAVPRLAPPPSWQAYYRPSRTYQRVIEADDAAAYYGPCKPPPAPCMRARGERSALAGRAVLRAVDGLHACCALCLPGAARSLHLHCRNVQLQSTDRPSRAPACELETRLSV